MRLHGLQYSDLNQIETGRQHQYFMKQKTTENFADFFLAVRCFMFHGKTGVVHLCLDLIKIGVLLSMLPQPFMNKMHTPVVPCYLARYCLKCNTKLHHTISHLIIFYLWIMSLGCYSFQHVSPSVPLCAA